MSSDERLKRLGLEHLKNDPEALREALDKIMVENEKKELQDTLARLKESQKEHTGKELPAALNDRIQALEERIKNMGGTGKKNEGAG